MQGQCSHAHGPGLNRTPLLRRVTGCMVRGQNNVFEEKRDVCVRGVCGECVCERSLCVCVCV